RKTRERSARRAAEPTAPWPPAPVSRLGSSRSAPAPLSRAGAPPRRPLPRAATHVRVPPVAFGTRPVCAHAPHATSPNSLSTRAKTVNPQPGPQPPHHVGTELEFRPAWPPTRRTHHVRSRRRRSKLPARAI